MHWSVAAKDKRNVRNGVIDMVGCCLGIQNYIRRGCNYKVSMIVEEGWGARVYANYN